MNLNKIPEKYLECLTIERNDYNTRGKYKVFSLPTQWFTVDTYEELFDIQTWVNAENKLIDLSRKQSEILKMAYDEAHGNNNDAQT